MIREYKPTMRVLFDRWALVRMELQTSLCVWRLCEQKAAELNAEPGDRPRPVTPFQILAWIGQWQLDTEVRAIRPVEGCDCPLCRDARNGGAR